jgi:hypothetical protein
MGGSDLICAGEVEFGDAAFAVMAAGLDDHIDGVLDVLYHVGIGHRDLGLERCNREPLHGQSAICPVDPDFRHYYLSPKRCVENLIRGANAEAAALGRNRCMSMPGQSLTIRQMIDAMTAVAGPEPATRIKWQEQPDIAEIVKGWRFDYRPQRALALGLEADDGFEENVRFYMQEDMPKD